MSLINHFFIDSFNDPYCNEIHLSVCMRIRVKTWSTSKDLLHEIRALLKPMIKLLWYFYRARVLFIILKILCLYLLKSYCAFQHRVQTALRKCSFQMQPNSQNQLTSFSSSAAQSRLNAFHIKDKSNRSIVTVIKLSLSACPLWEYV